MTLIRKEQTTVRAWELCRQVLSLSRNSLLMHLHYLSRALYALKLSEDAATDTAGSSGSFFYCDPFYVLRLYKKRPEDVNRLLLHTVLHCIFRHPFVGKDIDVRLWNLSCDIAAEHRINALSAPCCAHAGRKEQEDAVSRYRSLVKPFTAENLYRFLLDAKTPERELIRLEELFIRDDHALWYPSVKNTRKDGEKPMDTSGQNGDVPTDGNIRLEEVERSGDGKEDTVYVPVKDDSKAEKMWEEISRSIENELESLKGFRGDGDGELMRELRSINRDRTDYTRFLQQFAVQGEDIRINDEEFDYIFYTYGLKLYENMPLIEPLEYREVKKIRDFVIAIDTSRSTSGKLVEDFVIRTCSMLAMAENFFTRVNIRLIQCGAGISSDAKITCKEDLEEYMKSFRLYGLGGTDFRPVFRYVDKLRKDGELADLKGLIYFTDGYGIYPEQPPDYRTVFIFCREDEEAPKVPVWAMKLVLTPEEVSGRMNQRDMFRGT